MVYGRQNTLAWFEMQGKPYFSIFRKSESQSGNFVFTNRNRENETMETAKAYLDQCLRILGSGDFFMFSNEGNEKTSSKGRSETFFSITLNEQTASTPAPQMAAVSGISPEEVDRRAEEKFRQLMKDKELEDLKKRNIELEKENKILQRRTSEPINKFLHGLSPYIGTIAESFGLKKAPVPAVSGVKPDEDLEDNEQTEGTEIDQATAEMAVKEFLEALSKKYPNDWLDILKKLTTAIVNEPEKIDMAIKFL